MIKSSIKPVLKILTQLKEFFEAYEKHPDDLRKDEVINVEAGTAISRTQDYARLAQIWLSRRKYFFTKYAETRVCPCCSSSESEPLFISQDEYTYVRCLSCGMWYISEYIPDSAWDIYQNQESEVVVLHDRQFSYNCSEEYYQSDKQRFSSYFDKIISFQQKRKLVGYKYLDIGCFTGNSLKVANSEYGMQAFGVESSKRALEYLDRELPSIRSNIFESGEVLTSALSEQKFDLISMWETLEHATNPRDSLLQARELLATGGLLALTIPNAQSILPMMLKNYCFYCVGGADTQGHINMFSPETITNFLSNCGFKTIFLETIYSTDWRQVLYYLTGEWQKIYCIRNLLTGACLEYEEPWWITSFSNSIGSPLSELEQALNFGPMIFLLAEVF